ncbi:hypothetical protein Sm713_61880 [Streptomyces sp. TS71-3]|nr:hypothetical protein Sm713_61880 [Streptomyces sp. TS71-3]
MLSSSPQQGIPNSPRKAPLCTVLFTLGSAIRGAVRGRTLHRARRPPVMGGTALIDTQPAATVQAVGEPGPGGLSGAPDPRAAPLRAPVLHPMRTVKQLDMRHKEWS